MNVESARGRNVPGVLNAAVNIAAGQATVDYPPSMENATRQSIVVPGKTGTITEGKPAITDLIPDTVDGPVKSPISALRFILRHCGVP